MREAVAEWLRFAGVGVLNSAIDFAAFTIGITFGLPLLASTAMSWTLAVSFSYFANSRWTFRRSWGAILRPSPYARFVFGNALSFVLATAVLLAASQWMAALLAKAISSLVALALNFFIARSVASRAMKLE